MEKTMQVEERIRRAEEIYARRRMNNGIRVSTNSIENKRQISLFKKIVLQITICLLIYFIFYTIKNSNYIFSENVLNNTRNFLSYDINFEKIYSNVESFYNDNIKKFFITEKEKNETEEKDDKKEENKSENNTEKQENVSQKDEKVKEEVGIGGGEETLAKEEQIKETSADEEPTRELSQMEIDANEIKNNYSLIVPLIGTISSRFGPRTPTNIVSANHAGIDIAANEGTVFNASMSGTVTFVSTQGGYGNHFWIQKDDVITLYAHCSKIYVKEGDIISQGDEIGEVGHTGNATGPHLHFEIRKDGRVVDPELILEF